MVVLKALASWLDVIAPVNVVNKKSTSGAVCPWVPVELLNGPVMPFWLMARTQ
jgi:hypothetical protein